MTIKVNPKKVWGNVLYFISNPKIEDAIIKLTGNKTLTLERVNLLRDLGIEIEIGEPLL